jgi:hypothetical protein
VPAQVVSWLFCAVSGAVWPSLPPSQIADLLATCHQLYIFSRQVEIEKVLWIVRRGRETCVGIF